jgi:hypothetical protein
VDGNVRALAVDEDGNLFAAGSFNSAGGAPAKNIARWDGSSWSPLGSGTNATVNALAIDQSGILYAGGHFSNAGGIAAQKVARWDGNSWSALGAGVGQEMGGLIEALSTDGYGNLFAGGTFTEASGTEANRLARWDGSSWHSLGSGMDSAYGYSDDLSVRDLVVDSDGNLYAGGYFYAAGESAANNIAMWDGSGWAGIGEGNGLSGGGTLEADRNGNLYVGGSLYTAGNIVPEGIARWDGSAWWQLGLGISGGVICDLAVDQEGILYAGGTFTLAGGVEVNHVARWNGIEWSALGTGLDGRVNALAVDADGDLFAAGWFTSAGGVMVNHIARWDGNTWAPLGEGIGLEVNALAVDGNGILYAAGTFNEAGGVPANSIARWDGSTWSPIASGLDGHVHALVVDENDVLYAGGSFGTAGELTVNNIAGWDGSSWFPLGDGTDVTVLGIAVDESGDLYAAGYFQSAGGVTVNHIAKWDEDTWLPLGSGFGGFGASAASVAVGGNGDVYVGGYFWIAGDKPSDNIAHWIASALTVGDDAFTVFEDSHDNLMEVLANDGGSAAGSLSIVEMSIPDQGGTATHDGEIITYTPAPDFAGIETFTYTASDGEGGTGSGSVQVTVTNINDPPSFTKGNDLIVAEDAGPQTFTAWAKDIASGPPSESDQILTFFLTPDNSSLFALSPTIDPATGNLTFTPAPDISGNTAISVILNDNGGVENGGQNTSPPQNFHITITSVNDPPVLDAIGAQSVEVGEQLSLQITASDVDLPAQNLTFGLVEMPEGAILSADGLFTWTPSKEQGPGEYQVTVQVTDDGAPAESDSQTFTITVIKVEFQVFLPVIS